MLEPDGGDGGCRLTFTHTFDDRYGAPSFATGWDTCLRDLGSVLAGDEPAATQNVNALHERYVAALGLEGGTLATDATGGWTLRIERQLTQPAADAWRWLSGSGSDMPAVGGPPPGGFAIDGATPGSVREVAAPEALEYEWLADGLPAGRVRWELGAGTGHGARLVLTQIGPPDTALAAPAALLAAWEQPVARLAQHLAATPRPG